MAQLQFLNVKETRCVRVRTIATLRSHSFPLLLFWPLNECVKFMITWNHRGNKILPHNLGFPVINIKKVLYATFEVINSVDVFVNVKNHQCLINKEWFSFLLHFWWAIRCHQHLLFSSKLAKKVLFIYPLDFYAGNVILIFMCFSFFLVIKLSSIWQFVCRSVSICFEFFCEWFKAYSLI